MNKTWKYIWIGCATFFLLITALLLFTQTELFRKKVKSQVIRVVENQTNLKLEIGSVEGNFLKTIRFRDVRFRDADTIIASFNSLLIDYDPVPLLRQNIVIDSVVLEQPRIFLKQYSDSTWNVSSVTKSRKKNTISTGFPFSIFLNRASIKNGQFKISSLSEIVPQTIQDLNLLAGLQIDKEATEVRLQQLEFRTDKPAVALKKLSGMAWLNKKGIRVDSLLFVAGNSNLEMQGNYHSLDDMNAQVYSGRINKDDFAIFVPSFKLLCSPKIKAELVALKDSVRVNLGLEYKEQKLTTSLNFKSITDLTAKNKKVPYTANINLQHFRLHNWIKVGEQHGMINGKIDVVGENLLDYRSKSTVNARLEDSQFNNLAFNHFELDAIYEKDSLNARLNLFTNFGKIGVNGRLNIKEVPEYNAELMCSDIDLSKLVPKLKGTRVNGNITVQGHGFTADDLLANAQINLINSSVYKLPIDSLDASLDIDQNGLSIDSLLLSVPGAVVTGSGYLDLDSLLLDSRVWGEISTLDVIDSFVELPFTFDSTLTETTIKGSVRSLKIGGNVSVFNSDGYSTNAKRIEANYLVLTKKDSLKVEVDGKSHQTKIGQMNLDSLQFDYCYTREQMGVTAHVYLMDNLDAKINSLIRLGDTLSVDVSQFDVNSVLSSYYLPDTMKLCIYNGNRLEVENLKLKDYKQDDFVLAANGTISGVDTNAFNIEINKFDLTHLNRFIEKEDSLKGYLKSKVELRGNAINPEIHGNIEIVDPVFGKYSGTTIETKFHYVDQKGVAEVFVPEKGESFYAQATAAFDAYIDSLKFVFEPPGEFRGKLQLDSIDIAEIVNVYTSNDSIYGLLNGNIEVEGDYRNPLFFGALSISDGHYINKDLGVEYSDIESELKLNGNQISFDTVTIKQKDGLIALSGQIEFDSTIIKGNIKSSALEVNADQFFVTKHRNYEILIDANTYIRSANQNPQFGGHIKVIRSDLFLPALAGGDKNSVENDVPLLVQAIEPQADTVGQVLETGTVENDRVKRQSRMMKQLTGRLQIEIPRNTWIKSNDMRVELSGELEVEKNGAYFELFGNIEVLRGHYILYGRKLNVTESQIIFQGGEELDPTLNITTEYVYRGSDKEKRYLELLITGELSDPEIDFILDGSEISETDGVSILVFGATSDEIGYGGQNGLLGSVSSNAVASLVSSQLSRTIGSQLNLDMIEVTTTESWQSAAFVVGKYITNDIFVIYERGFGEVSGDEITPETVTVEYEINDKLFLRLQSGNSKESGVDVILKFEQEEE